MCDDMYAKIKEFVIKHRYIVIGIFIFVIVFAAFVFCQRKNVSDNGNTINSIRNELEQSTDTQQGIAETADEIKDTSTELANTIGTAQETSTGFEQLINECKDIIEQIRNQPAE